MTKSKTALATYLDANFASAILQNLSNIVKNFSRGDTPFPLVHATSYIIILYSVHTYGAADSPLGEGRHLVHLPQLHFDPPPALDRLFMVARLADASSLLAPPPLVGAGAEEPGLA